LDNRMAGMPQDPVAYRNLWWQTLTAAVLLVLITVGYYWAVQGSAADALALAVQDYISNWPVVTAFFLLAAASLWLRLRDLPGEVHARMRALNGAGLLSLLLGSSGLLLALGILVWQVSWPSLRAMVEALAYPPVFVTGSTSLIIAGLALASASWPRERRGVFLRSLARISLIALLGLLPLIVWAGVQILRLQLQTSAVLGLILFLVALLLLLAGPKGLRPRTAEKPTGPK